MRTANVSQLTQTFTDRLRSQNIKLLRGIFCNVLIFIKRLFFKFVRTILNRSLCFFSLDIFFIFLNETTVLKNFVRSQKRWPALSGTRFNKQREALNRFSCAPELKLSGRGSTLSCYSLNLVPGEEGFHQHNKI